jgi:hypothetical protein
MTAATFQATPPIAMPALKTISRSEHTAALQSCALDLSKSRTHEAVLDILRAYKLTGNFYVNLEIVLKDIGVFDKVTYQIERNPNLSYSPDCRHVVFNPNGNVPNDIFDEIIKSIKARIGYEAPWWVRLFRAFYDEVDPPSVIACLAGLSRIHGRWLLDRPVKPSDDSADADHPNRRVLQAHRH